MKLPFALALALASAAIAPAAFAEEAKQLRFNDLDLDTPAGKAELTTRIDAIARTMCKAHESTGTRLGAADCRREVRREALAKVDEYQNRVGKGG